MSLPPAGEGGDPSRAADEWARSAIRPYLNVSQAVQPPAEQPPVEQPQMAPRSGDPPRETLRPFVLTSGRVNGVDPAICVETQVTARAGGSRVRSVRLAPELKAIVMLCSDPFSVAEISSRLRLHLGVVKVLVGDLRASGYVDVHTVETPNTPDLILRVIRGLSVIT